MRLILKCILVLILIASLSLIIPFLLPKEFETKEKEITYVLYNESLKIAPEFMNRSYFLRYHDYYIIPPFSNITLPLNFTLPISSFILKLETYEASNQTFSFSLYNTSNNEIFSKEDSRIYLEIPLENNSFPVSIIFKSISNQTIYLTLNAAIIWRECTSCYLISNQIFIPKGNFTQSKLKIELSEEVNTSIFEERPIYLGYSQNPLFSFKSKTFEIEDPKFNSFFLSFFETKPTDFNVKVVLNAVQFLPVYKYYEHVKVCWKIFLICLLLIFVLFVLFIFLKIREKFAITKLKKKWSFIH
jgi:hypothetical protein